MYYGQGKQHPYKSQNFCLHHGFVDGKQQSNMEKMVEFSNKKQQEKFCVFIKTLANYGKIYIKINF